MRYGWLAGLVLVLAGCGSSSGGGHFVNTKGQMLSEFDYLWEQVNEVFPGALPRTVKLVWVGGLNASFMIDSSAIGIPTMLQSNIRRGKICRELTHLALHYLSGGDTQRPGRCFDNDVAFLEQALAGYMDRKGAGVLEEDLEAASNLAADLFRNEGLKVMDLRDWETFFYRGYWTDQFHEWNMDGLRALTTLGDYMERNFTLSLTAGVFRKLDDDLSLDQAVKEVLNVELELMLEDWRDEILARVPEEAAAE
jgi:hypothetical protein